MGCVCAAISLHVWYLDSVFGMLTGARRNVPFSTFFALTSFYQFVDSFLPYLVVDCHSQSLVSQSKSKSKSKSKCGAHCRYVTFMRDDDAMRCIQAVDGCATDNKVLRSEKEGKGKKRKEREREFSIVGAFLRSPNSYLFFF